jgi:hypothetical protein
LDSSSTSLCVKRRKFTRGTIDLYEIERTEIRSTYESRFELTSNFIPTNLKGKLLANRLKTWVIVDEFVFVFDWCLFV